MKQSEFYCPILDDECVQEKLMCEVCLIQIEFLDSESDEDFVLSESEIDCLFDCFDEDDLIIKFSNYEDSLEIDLEDLPF